MPFGEYSKIQCRMTDHCADLSHVKGLNSVLRAMSGIPLQSHDVRLNTPVVGRRSGSVAVSSPITFLRNLTSTELSTIQLLVVEHVGHFDLTSHPAPVAQQEQVKGCGSVKSST